MAVTEPAVAVKVAEEEPEATLTAEGTVRAALLLERTTLDPPLGAARERVTVQPEVAPEAMLVGLHCSEDTDGSVPPGAPIGVIMSL